MAKLSIGGLRDNMMTKEEFLAEMNEFRTRLGSPGEAPGFTAGEVLSAYAYYQSMVVNERSMAAQEDYQKAMMERVKGIKEKGEAEDQGSVEI